MASHSSWSDLPQDILDLIFHCAKDPIDIVRCGAVCKSWLPTALQVYRKFLPLCFILSGNDLEDTRTLFNLFTQETQKIELPDAKGNLIFCSYNTWLLIFDHNTFPNRMRLLDIFSRTCIDLPELTPSLLAAFLKYYEGIPLNWKLLLSKSPSSSDCIVFLLQNTVAGLSTISSWKPGEKKWKDMNFGFPIMFDAILCKGKLFAIFNDGADENFLITCNYQLEMEAINPIPASIFQFYILVQSLNEGLLLVGFNFTYTSIRILEFDICTRRLREVIDLGGCALLISPNYRNHILAKAGNLGTLFKANRVYLFRERNGEDAVEFDLATRSYKIVPCQFRS